MSTTSSPTGKTMKTLDWRQNDDLFFQECLTGHFWERYVGLFLSKQRLDVQLGEQTLRENIEEAEAYADQVDLVCQGANLEIKSRSLLFTSPSDLPFPDMIVDTVSGWEKKSPEPDFVVAISQLSGAMVYLPTTTRSRWERRRAYDRVRRIEGLFYFASRELWSPIHELVLDLRYWGKEVPALGEER